MRTTIELPDDLNRIVRGIAAETNQTLSETIAALIRRGLGESAVRIGRSERTGLPLVRLGKIVATDEARSLET